MSKYAAVGELLDRRGEGPATLGLEEIAAAVSGGLPASAYRHRSWWGNETAGGHAQCAAWLRAGWSVEQVDLAARTVAFIRSSARR